MRCPHCSTEYDESEPVCPSCERSAYVPPGKRTPEPESPPAGPARKRTAPAGGAGAAGRAPLDVRIEADGGWSVGPDKPAPKLRRPRAKRPSILRSGDSGAPQPPPAVPERLAAPEVKAETAASWEAVTGESAGEPATPAPAGEPATPAPAGEPATPAPAASSTLEPAAEVAAAAAEVGAAIADAIGASADEGASEDAPADEAALEASPVVAPGPSAPSAPRRAPALPSRPSSAAPRTAAAVPPAAEAGAVGDRPALPPREAGADGAGLAAPAADAEPADAEAQPVAEAQPAADAEPVADAEPAADAGPVADAGPPAGDDGPAPTAAIELPVQAAGFWRRALAQVVDLGPLLLGLVIFYFPLSWLLPLPDFPPAREHGIDFLVDLALREPLLLLPPGLGLVLAFLTYATALKGRSLGQRALKLTVVGPGGAEISRPRALVRGALVLVFACLFGLGLVWAGFDRERKALHDRLCGTVVALG